MLLLKDIFGRWNTRILNAWHLFQKNVYFHLIDDIVNKYNNTVQITIKIKPIDVTSDYYAEYNEDSNEKDPKF